MKVKKQYLKILEYLHLSFNEWPSIQCKFWVSLVLWNHNNGEDCWLGNDPEDEHWHPPTKKVSHRRSLLKAVAVYRVLYQSILIAKLTGGRIWVGKGAQATGMTASLRIQSSKADSNTWESFTRSGLKLESVHQESPRSDVFRKRATKPLLNQRQRQKHLTWAVEKKNWTVAQRSKVLFQMKVNFAFYLEIKVPESGERVERHRIHVAWSPVWSFHSQWWFWLPCHLLVLVHCVFWSPQSTQPSPRKS